VEQQLLVFWYRICLSPTNEAKILPLPLTQKTHIPPLPALHINTDQKPSVQQDLQGTARWQKGDPRKQKGVPWWQTFEKCIGPMKEIFQGTYQLPKFTEGQGDPQQVTHISTPKASHRVHVTRNFCRT